MELKSYVRNIVTKAIQQILHGLVGDYLGTSEWELVTELDYIEQQEKRNHTLKNGQTGKAQEEIQEQLIHKPKQSTKKVTDKENE